MRARGRPVALLVAMLATGALGFAGVTAVGAVVGDEAADHDHAGVGTDRSADLRAEPGTDSVEGREPHPTGGAPWSVVVFRSRDGRTCAAPGRNVGGRVGAINGGRFSEYPIDEGASCVDLDAVPAGAQITTGVGSESSTIVHGVAGPKVEAIEIHGPSGTQQPPLGRRGGFVAVLPAGTEIADLDVVARLEDGDAVTLL